MKNKMGKGLWIMLSIGLFILVLAGIGAGYMKEKQQQEQLNEELGTAQSEVAILAQSKLPAQKATAETQLEQTQTQLTEIKNQFNVPMVSTDVFQTLTDAATKEKVKIVTMTSSGDESVTMNTLPFNQLKINMIVIGNISDIYNFIKKLESIFPSAVLEPVTITGEEAQSTATMGLTIYSFAEE